MFHTRPAIPVVPHSKQRLLIPGLSLTNGTGIFWMMRLILGDLVVKCDGQPWRWDDPSSVMRARIKEIMNHLQRTHSAAYAPIAHAEGWGWESHEDWHADRNEQWLLVDLSDFHGWDVFTYDTGLEGQVFHNRPAEFVTRYAEDMSCPETF